MCPCPTNEMQTSVSVRELSLRTGRQEGDLSIQLCKANFSDCKRAGCALGSLLTIDIERQEFDFELTANGLEWCACVLEVGQT